MQCCRLLLKIEENSILSFKSFLKPGPKDFPESPAGSDDRCRHIILHIFTSHTHTLTLLFAGERFLAEVTTPINHARCIQMIF